MKFDEFSVQIDPKSFIRWPDGGGFQPAEILINGVPLIEMVRLAEESLVRDEQAERIAEGEDPATCRVPAGDYLYMPPSLVFLPSRNLLDQPYVPGFELEPGDPRFGKAAVLGCTCGVVDCWLLQVRITLSGSSVRWSEFGQFHRPGWKYDLGPFEFEREQYESELARRA